MNLFWIIAIALIWIIGAFIAYKKVISAWDNPKGEKIYFSIVWPLLLPLFGIHWLHNNL